jgi:tetratricopeptide (TPR) repeat protein
MGILAGRLKRRWLTERIASDFQRARALYSEALQLSEADGDHAQAYYHAINVAFLDLAALPEASDVPEGVRSCARRALEHCAGADASHWRDATEGEARLMLGDLVQAEQKYRQAVAQADSTRDIDSMYVQAVRVAGRVFGEDGVTRIEEIFGVGRGPG